MKRIKILGTLFSLLSTFSCSGLGLQKAGPYTELSNEARRLAVAVDQKDLLLGMGQQHVRRSWGEPIRVETAGEDGSGLERWIYSDGLLNPAFREFSRERIVYFEQGQVVGWESL